MAEEIEYIIVDFNGYVPWTERNDGTYAVDPLYLDQFLKEFE
jgi:hypothetical protein